MPDSTPHHSDENAVLKGPRIVRNTTTGDFMTVVERRADHVAGARGPASLVFSTDLGFTRLWNYPSNWTELSDAELVALSDKPRA